MNTLVNKRPIRSYVLRQGRMTDAQKRAVEALGQAFLIPFTPEALDARARFGRAAPLILEIGCGMGETTTQIARQHPDMNYLGVEVHSPGIGSLLKQIDAHGLTNIRLVQHDAVEVVQHMLIPNCLHGVHIFFPDPWPKKRHHKRRLLQPEFVALLASRLQPGGYLHCATDWADYAAHMLEVLSGEPGLRNTATGFSPRPDYRPVTKFEGRGLRLGHEVVDLVFAKVPSA